MSLPETDDFEDRRAAGKREADELRSHYLDLGDPLAWFEACYRGASGDVALIPWATMTRRPELVDWLDRLPAEGRRGRVLDVGCGLGDNAVLLAEAGFEVTAFDISATAVAWAEQRFAGHAIDWQSANLVAPPESWRGAFDLVSEIYTLQTLRPPYREAAFEALASFVKPGGTLLLIGRGRHLDEPESPPPWPLTLDELEFFKTHGLEQVQFEDFLAPRKDVRHFRVEYRRPGR